MLTAYADAGRCGTPSHDRSRVHSWLSPQITKCHRITGVKSLIDVLARVEDLETPESTPTDGLRRSLTTSRDERMRGTKPQTRFTR